ncbi:MAG: pyruvate kinase [Candidatus Melainabacteria bacterium]|nr:pyruvate kinase [Candidatus Melainabacteria bacterium]
MPTSRLTKIIATLGPASTDPKTISDLIKAGVNVFRINCSHTDPETRSNVIRIIRNEAKKQGRVIGVLVDLQGPKIRVGKLKDGCIHLLDDSELVLTSEQMLGNANKFQVVNFDKIISCLKPSERILLNDGLIELKITDVMDKKNVKCKVIYGGELKDGKGINFPDSNLKDVPALTEKDIEDLKHAQKEEAELIALSFVRSAEDVKAVRKYFAKDSKIKVIAKIEKPQAIEDMDNILKAFDGIMVARGDLGVELSYEKLPAIQKQIIQKANEGNVLVITATQMLESMIHSPRPTRAELSDVANAIFDGSDAIMLSGETAVGKYPVLAVETMHKVAVEAERVAPRHRHEAKTVQESIARSACALAERIKATAIVSFTSSGKTALLVSKQRPPVKVIALTQDQMVGRQVALYWGITPLFLTEVSDTEAMMGIVEKALLDAKMVELGDTVVITAGMPIAARGDTNFIKIHKCEGLFHPNICDVKKQ